MDTDVVRDDRNPSDETIISATELTQDAGVGLSDQPGPCAQLERFLCETCGADRGLRAVLLWRDAVALGGAVLAAALYLSVGARGHDVFGLISGFVVALALLWVSTVVVLYRVRQRPMTPASGEPLFACAQNALARINEQIWLRENVLWWCLLPVGAALFASSAYTACRFGIVSQAPKLTLPAGLCSLAAGLYVGHRLERRRVRNVLRPRREELQALLESLQGGER